MDRSASEVLNVTIVNVTHNVTKLNATKANATTANATKASAATRKTSSVRRQYQPSHALASPHFRAFPPATHSSHVEN